MIFIRNLNYWFNYTKEYIFNLNLNIKRDKKERIEKINLLNLLVTKNHNGNLNLRINIIRKDIRRLNLKINDKEEELMININCLKSLRLEKQMEDEYKSKSKGKV